jgi:hypothetical protein
MPLWTPNRGRYDSHSRNTQLAMEIQMPSFQTLFRAVVLIVVGVVGVKAWKLYGPTNEQVNTTVAQVIETVQSTVESWQQPTANLPPDPRTGAAPMAQAPLASTPATPPVPLAQTDAPKLLPQATESAPSTPATVQPADAPANDAMPSPVPVGGDRAQQLVSRLQQLGAADTKLAPWGNDGNLYRFSCRAPVVNAPALTQHFESIAADPAAAVQEVLLKVESWHIAQRNSAGGRY